MSDGILTQRQAQPPSTSGPEGPEQPVHQDGFNQTAAFKLPSGGPVGDLRAVSPEHPLLGYKGQASWQFAWQTAIALAWASDEQKEFLKRDPRAFFRYYANYELPEGLDFKVEEMSADAAGKQPGWDQEKGQWYLQNTQLTMYLPPAPPVDQRPVALAAYNATARCYPFTIC